MKASYSLSVVASILASILALAACPAAPTPTPSPGSGSGSGSGSAPPSDASVSVPDASTAGGPGPSGSVVLTLSAPPAAGLCGRAPVEAAISVFSVSVLAGTPPAPGVDAGRACVPVSAKLSGPGGVLATTAGTCPGPTQVTCIESAQTLELDGVPPGSYEVDVAGLSQGRTCWLGVASVGVVSGGSTAQRLSLLPQPIDGCPTVSAQAKKK